MHDQSRLAGLSEAKLAALTGLFRNQIGRAEAGETLPLLVRATMTVMNLAMVAKAEMAMAQVAEGRTMDEKEQAEDANLDVLLAQIAVALGAVEAMRKELYKDDSGPDPLKTKGIRPDGDPSKEG